MNSDKLLLVEFGAPWCKPCAAQLPILESLQEEFSSVLEVRKVNIDEEVELSNQYSIRSVPTLMFFRDGKMLDMRVGLTSKQTLSEQVLRYM